MRRSFFRRLIAPAAALVLPFMLTGCAFDLTEILAFFTDALSPRVRSVGFGELPILSKSHDEAEISGTAAVSGTIVLEVDYDDFDFNRSMEVSASGPDGRAPVGVTVSPQVTTPFPPTLEVQYEIQPDAVARPFTITVTVRGDRKVGSTDRHLAHAIQTGSFPFFLRRAGGDLAPRITGGIPGAIARGVPTRVVFSGANLDATTELAAEPGVGVSDVEMDAAAGTVAAAILVPADQPVGERRFHVVTGAGESNRWRIGVTATRPPPVLTGLFPNYGAAGAVTAVHFAGERFQAGALVAAPGLALSGDATLLSSFALTQSFRPTGAARVEGVSVETLDGATTDASFFVEPPGFRGPRIVAIRPATLTAGAVNQVEIVFESAADFYGQANVELIGLPNETVPQPLAAARLLPPRERAPRATVAILDVPANPSTTSFLLAARVGSASQPARNTNAHSIGLLTRGLSPLLARAATGRVARGGETLDTLHGERLAGASRLRFSHPTISGEVLSIAPDGRSVNVRIRAATTAPHTGDARTVLTLDCTGGRSNEVSYIVESASGGGTPRIDTLAPNWAYRGGNIDFLANGAGFIAPLTVFIRPSEGAQTATPNLRDARNFTVAASFPPGSNLVAYFLSATAPGGTSAEVSIPVLDASIERGPEVDSAGFFPGSTSIIPDTPAQIGIPGEFLTDASGATTLVALPLADEAITVLASRFRPAPTAGGELGGVLEITASLASGTALYGSRFALRRGDGLLSAPFVLQLSRAGAQVPTVRAITPSELPRGQTTLVTLTGERLASMNAFDFSVDSVTAANIAPSADGTSLTAQISVAADAPLTGDARTVFQVFADPGNPSNETSFIIPAP